MKIKRIKRRFRFVHRIMMMLNMVVALLLIIASYSYFISPNKSLIFSYLGLLFPFFLLLNCIFLLYWMIFGKWLRFFIAFCALLICWKPVYSYIPLNFFASKAPENTIKILSYNVMAFGYLDHTAAKPNPILQYIAESDADIVCLQEYLAVTSRGLTQEKIAKALSMYPYHYTLPLVDFRNYSVGLGIFSKFPIRKSWKVRYDSAFNGSTVHELDVNGRKVYVINNHLESFKLTMGDRQKYTEFINNISADNFDGLLETVQHKLGSAYQIRAEQAEIVADEIKQLQNSYLVICGDFNDTPISYAYRTVRGTLGDAYEESGIGPGVTFNQSAFRFRIDHILHSSNIKAYEAAVDNVSYSDHYPIYCRLKLE